MIDIISQLWITVFGVGAIRLVSLKNPQYSKWAYVSGLIAQPAWYYTLIHNEQYILVAIGVCYTLSWINGFRNHILGGEA